MFVMTGEQDFEFSIHNLHRHGFVVVDAAKLLFVNKGSRQGQHGDNKNTHGDGQVGHKPATISLRAANYHKVPSFMTEVKTRNTEQTKAPMKIPLKMMKLEVIKCA